MVQFMTKFDLPLVATTPDTWAPCVLNDFPRFLQDHAACERKAAALAMSLVAKYTDREALVEPMVALAREELEHFQQVYRLMVRKRVPLATADQKDGYINAILKGLRHGREERLLDRLIISGLVEARGFERFALLADSLLDDGLKQFYRQLSDREAGHYKIFVNCARHYFPEEQVNEALERISKIEAQAMLSAPIRPTLH